MVCLMTDKKMLNKAIITMMISTWSNMLMAVDCTDSADTMYVTVDSNSVVRPSVPETLFGFNVPWRTFQKAYMNSLGVREQVINYLKFFPGAAYRYPGGSPSNDFEWRKSIGQNKLRPPMHFEFGLMDKALFGLDEYIQFVKDVDGNAIYTANLKGPYQSSWTNDEIAKDVKDLLGYIAQPEHLGCTGGDKCRLKGVELGNELDWSPYKLSPEEYVARVNSVLKNTAEYNDVAWIANGATAPWSGVGDYKNFNSAVANALSGKVAGIAIHPYYDGINVPAAMNYVKEYAETWSKSGAASPIFITEHARWPDGSGNKNWSDYWYQSTGLGGAISTADFLIEAIKNDNVRVAQWHALSAYGPWKLIKLDEANNELYPGPVYWGLRVLREAFLKNAIKVEYQHSLSAAYSGGYDLNIIAMMSDDKSRHSLLGVNRKTRSQRIHLHWVDSPVNTGSLVSRWITSESKNDDNDDESKSLITMKTQTETVAKGETDIQVCVPKNAVFSFEFK